MNGSMQAWVCNLVQSSSFKLWHVCILSKITGIGMHTSGEPVDERRRRWSIHGLYRAAKANLL